MHKLKSTDYIGKILGDSREQVRRCIRLTYLIPELLKLVDNSFIYDKYNTLKLGLTTAVELSYLNINEQKLLYYVIGHVDATPCRAQSIRIRNTFLKDKVTFDKLEKILSEEKGYQHEQIIFN